MLAMRSAKRTQQPGLRVARNERKVRDQKRSNKLLLIAVLMAILLYFFINNATAANEHSRNLNAGNQMEQPLLFNKNETWTGECKRKKANDTWGEEVAPLVDKVAVKEIVRKWVPSVNVVPTVAILDEMDVKNFTIETMRSLPDNIVLKPAHMSGGVSSFVNGTYHCFKRCKAGGKARSDEKVFQRMKRNLQHDISADYYASERERQYKFIPKRIIVEERLPLDKMDETHWWVVNGFPVFSSIKCKTDAGKTSHTYVSTSYRRLNMMMKKEPCETLPLKPKKWEEMKRIAHRLGSHYNGIVRIDLFSSDEGVWFGEFTFTSAGCLKYYDPIQADALLYNILVGRKRREEVTPEFVEQYINGLPSHSSSFS